MAALASSSQAQAQPQLPKAPTGIQGLDEITFGGLPKGRPTLLCGGPGSGKTLMAMEFLVRGATEFGEPGVFVAFEENVKELAENFRSLGFDLDALQAQKKLVIDYIYVEPREIVETGEYDLEALFLRIGDAIDSIGAKRVVLDTIESLFTGFSNLAILRAELRRLLRWLKDRGVTAIVTGERGEGPNLTRQGLEEYVSDCVILLDHRVDRLIATRRLRIVKYRGSPHAPDEVPFMVTEHGVSVLPTSSMGLAHTVSSGRISSGVAGLDEMLEGKGFFRASTILISGSAGTGKTSVCAGFIDAACARGERCTYFAYEESPDQIVRNMRSIGIDLGKWAEKGLLRFHAGRPTLYGLETHLTAIHKAVSQFDPAVVVLDPLSALLGLGPANEVYSMSVRLIDYLKSRGVTTLLTNLVGGGENPELTGVGVSSAVDTWIVIRNLESAGARHRAVYIVKSRGMAHSPHVRGFTLTDKGVVLTEAPVPPTLAKAPQRRSPAASRGRRTAR